MRRLAALAAVLALSACALPQTRPALRATRATPMQEQGSWALGRGTNTIEGHAALTGADGAVRSCAGDAASLLPVTPATRSRMRGLYGADQDVAELHGGRRPPRDRTVERITRHARCDAEGRFRFTGLPDGAYFVVAGIPGRPPASVKREVGVGGGETRTIELGN